MPGINEDRERQVVPRWRDYKATRSRGELAPLRSPGSNQFSDEMLDNLLKDWQSNPSISVASDLVSCALTLGRFTTAIDAAHSVLSNNRAPRAARGLASTYLSETEGTPLDVVLTPGMRTVLGKPPTFGIQSHLYGQVRETRAQLERYPRNPILWCNLARLYTSLGLQEKATRSMKAALSMAPNNRFILRAGSRLHLHQGDKELAHRLLVNSASLKADPWILAGEIATAAANHKISNHIKFARKLLEDGRYPPFHVSELASALGTLELIAGNVKLGRKLVRTSLEHPTENAIAQAAWITRNVGISPMDWGMKTASYEANYWLAWKASDWATAIGETQTWQNDEPFSSRPAIHVSYLASVIFEDFSLAIDSARQGLRSNQRDVTLFNNLAFSLAQVGQVAEAKKVLNRAKLLDATQAEKIFLTATEGLIAFRNYQPDLGRSLYEKAISRAKTAGDSGEHVARLYLAREELLHHSPQAEDFRREALDSARSLTDPVHRAIVNRVRQFQAP